MRRYHFILSFCILSSVSYFQVNASESVDDIYYITTPPVQTPGATNAQNEEPINKSLLLNTPPVQQINSKSDQEVKTLGSSDVQNETFDTLTQSANQSNNSTWGSWVHGIATNALYNATANPEIEKAKFPEIHISTLMRYVDESRNKTSRHGDDNTNITLKGFKTDFNTNVPEGDPRHYVGAIECTQIEYGNVLLKYLGSTKGFSSGFSIEKPYPYIAFATFVKNHWVNVNQDPLGDKATPVRNSYGKTECTYTFFNGEHTKCIKLTIERMRK